MLELTRTVRFCLSLDGDEESAGRHNTFSAWPPMRGLGRYYELHVTCRGEADPRTGYFINIKHIDTAVRDHALPILRKAAALETSAEPTPMGTLMRDLIASLQPELNQTVAHLSLQLTPLVAFSIERPTPFSDSLMDHVLIKQQYEFSAAHRLHVPEYSEEQNRQTFGKCNNPAGHGHNYRVETVVRCPIDAQGQTLSVGELDALVDQHVIQHLDHKHLNRDVPQFAELNPSVEHIARVVWDMLAAEITSAFTNAQLHELSVWETGKTVCTYRGPSETVAHV